MNKLEIKSPIDILPELKIILSKLENAEDMFYNFEKRYVLEAKARLKQLTLFIESSGKRGSKSK